MSISFKNLFGKNTNIQEEKPFAQTPSKKLIARGRDGKFISKKERLDTSGEEIISQSSVKIKPAPAPAESAKEKVAPDEPVGEPTVQPAIDNTSNQPPVSTFYGTDIRKFLVNKVWYFNLEDILPLAQYASPRDVLDQLKEKEDFKKIWEKVVKSAENTSWVSYEGFIKLLPLIRDQEHMFPGPFPDWLKGISELPKPS